MDLKLIPWCKPISKPPFVIKFALTKNLFLLNLEKTLKAGCFKILPVKIGLV